MVDHWMRRLQLAMNRDDFHELPRNAAYRYELISGQVLISPHPRYYRCLLDLQTGPSNDGQTRPWEGPIRLLSEEDWESLEEPFWAAFSQTEPFAGLSNDDGRRASREALDRTRTGGDGPLISEACVIAEREGLIAGAALVTLLPAGDPTTWNGCHWKGTPPEDAIATRQGRPHLTWIFVTPSEHSRGIGAALLHHLCERLRGLGFTDLLSTFIDGNNRSMLWHWRMGFRLLQSPESYRRTLRAYTP